VKKFSPTQRILTTVLALALAGWAIDACLHGGSPRPAKAATAPAAPQAAPPSETEDSGQLVERLLSDKYTPITAELAQLERDLFLPTPLMQAATLPAPEPEEQPDPADGPPPAPDFASTHVLTGVIIGRVPLAQVDGLLLPLGAVLDGCTLVEIRRDFVVFERSDHQERVTLELKQRSANPNQTP
jgi:hypothetical protein